eukprot:3269067-Alexandrium_andersonii.AAC.1
MCIRDSEETAHQQHTHNRDENSSLTHSLTRSLAEGEMGVDGAAESIGLVLLRASLSTRLAAGG